MLNSIPNSFRPQLIGFLYRIRDRQKHRVRISTKSELEAMLLRSEEAFSQSHDAGIAFVNSWRFDLKQHLPKDPESKSYRDQQLELYSEISGHKPYHYRIVAQEPVNVDQAIASLYPYCTESLNVTGSHLIALGYWLQSMQIPKAASIIEFGAGCGDLSILLAKCGYEVTAVDISSSYVEVIRQRAIQEGVGVNTIISDMTEVRANQTFDVAIFCEAFHHCDNHVALLDLLDKILSNNAKIYFLGEPVTFFPMPWGVRLDGESIWAARKHGWLELGFDSKYFYTMLERRGWTLRQQRNPTIGHRAYCIEASRCK